VIVLEELQVKPQQATFNFQELRSRVHNRLTELNLPLHGSTKMLCKTLSILGAWCCSYALVLLWGTESVLGAAITLSILTFTSLTVQLAVMHDASHYCITAARWPNTLFRWSLTAMGGSSMLWYKNHVVAHHGQTNIPGHDPDIDSFGLLRFHHDDAWHFWHRWQHWYAFPLYSLKALFWVWVSDFIELFANAYHFKGRERALFVFELLASRASHVLLFLVAPYYILGSWQPVLLGYVAFMLAFGGTMTTIFILAHITDVQAFLPKGRTAHTDWARHQLETTSDFSVNNKVLGWLIGGLNFQVEHHIFPNISHLHYGIIQPVVKRYCQEHGITYHEFPNVRSALFAHFHQLRRFSRRKPQAA